MSRTVSPATQALIDAARERGIDVSARQVERWRQHGLLRAPERAWLGRGKGSVSYSPAGAVNEVIAVHEVVGRYRSLDEATLMLFADGHPVGDDAVRRAYTRRYQALIDDIRASDSEVALDNATAAARRLMPALLRDPRGRAMRRRLRGRERSADASLESSVIGLLHILIAGLPPRPREH